jgi:hypothetical protein
VCNWNNKTYYTTNEKRLKATTLLHKAMEYETTTNGGILSEERKPSMLVNIYICLHSLEENTMQLFIIWKIPWRFRWELENDVNPTFLLHSYVHDLGRDRYFSLFTHYWLFFLSTLKRKEENSSLVKFCYCISWKWKLQGTWIFISNAILLQGGAKPTPL